MLERIPSDTQRRSVAAGVAAMWGIAAVITVATLVLSAGPADPCGDWARDAAGAAEREVSASGSRVQVFLRDGATDEDRAQLETMLRGVPGVRNVTFESRAEAYRRFVELFEESQDFVDSVTPSALPESFRVTVDGPDVLERVRVAVSVIPAVAAVQDPSAARVTEERLLDSYRRAGSFRDGDRLVRRPAGCA